LAQPGRVVLRAPDQRQIKRGIHRSVSTLESAIATFIKRHNDSPKPFSWTTSADDILASIDRFCTPTIAVQNAKNFSPRTLEHFQAD